MYFVYILQSRKDNKLYIGYTEDLRVRFSLHTNGKVASTKNRRPLELIYYEAYQISLMLKSVRYFLNQVRVIDLFKNKWLIILRVKRAVFS